MYNYKGGASRKYNDVQQTDTIFHPLFVVLLSRS